MMYVSCILLLYQAATMTKDVRVTEDHLVTHPNHKTCNQPQAKATVTIKCSSASLILWRHKHARTHTLFPQIPHIVTKTVVFNYLLMKNEVWKLWHFNSFWGWYGGFMTAVNECVQERVNECVRALWCVRRENMSTFIFSGGVKETQGAVNFTITHYVLS